MCSFTVFVLLPCVVQANAKIVAANQVGNVQHPQVGNVQPALDKLLGTLPHLGDTLLNRAFKPPSIYHKDLENVMLGKPIGGRDHNQDQRQGEWNRMQPLARFSRSSKSVPWPVEEFGMEQANDNAEEGAVAASEASHFQKEATFLSHHETTSERSQSDRSDTEDIPEEHGVLTPQGLSNKLVDKLLVRAFEAARLHHTDLDNAMLQKPQKGHDHTQDQGQVELRRISRTPKSVPWPVEEFGMETANDNAEEAAIAANEAREASAVAATPGVAAAAEATFLHHHEAETSQSDRSDAEDIPANPSMQFKFPDRR
jgi:hypothetical protein